MYNDYNTITNPNYFDNYGGHHIDDRMKTRGCSYISLYQIDEKPHYATPEIIEEKELELKRLQQEYMMLYASVYGDTNRERMKGDELACTLLPLEMLGSKIANVKRFIATAHIIQTEGRVSDKVGILSNVTVQIQGVATPITLRIVGENDADIDNHEISCSSPVGKSLLGRKVGDSVDIKIENRLIRYRILSV